MRTRTVATYEGERGCLPTEVDANLRTHHALTLGVAEADCHLSG
ncbi:hypothetical protein JOF37_001547 [Microbacterium imperiale]|nr:hypothetical protein [Microbacterium imperiale]